MPSDFTMSPADKVGLLHMHAKFVQIRVLARVRGSVYACTKQISCTYARLFPAQRACVPACVPARVFAG